jgi:hypothetical protein
MSVLEGLESHCSGRRSGAGFGLRHGVPRYLHWAVQPCNLAVGITFGRSLQAGGRGLEALN